MRRFALFLIAVIPVLLAGIAANVWLDRSYWTRASGDGMDWFVKYKFWGGNPNEVFSHWVHMWMCSGAFAALQWLFFVERRLRRDQLAWKGNWTLVLGGVLLADFWWRCLEIEKAHGEGVTFIVLPLFFVPLFALTLVPLHILLSRFNSGLRDGFATLTAALAMLGAQLIFEPSSSGGPDLLFMLPTMIVAFVGITAPAIRLVSGTRQALRERGFTWVTRRDALFATLNGLRAGKLPPHEQVATLPGYREGDIRALCILARTS